MNRIGGERVALSNAEKIGLIVPVVTLLALVALASTGLRSTPPQPWLNLGKRASLITVCSAGIGLALLSAVIGFRIFSKQPSQPVSQNRASDPARTSGSASGSQGKEVEVVDLTSVTPLHLAARDGDLKKVSELINSSPDDIDKTDDYDRTPIHYAIYEGHAEVIEKLCEAEACPDIASRPFFLTPLHLAVDLGKVECVRVLLEHGAKTKGTRRRDDRHPILTAAMKGYSEIIHLLVKHRADINIKDGRRMTALDFAAQNRHLVTVRALLQAGANVNKMTQRNFKLIRDPECALELVRGGFNRLDDNALRAHWQKKGFDIKELNRVLALQRN